MKKLLLLLTLSLPVNAQAIELMGLKAFLKKELAGAAKMSKEKFSLSEAQVKELTGLAPDANDKSFTFYFAKDAKGSISTSCTAVPQKGKEGPLLIGVCFDSAGIVKQVTILTTNEERGRQIEEASFLSQFNGKKLSDAYTVGKDVDAVSGATWSSQAVSEAVRKTAFAFKTFVKGKK